MVGTLDVKQTPAEGMKIQPQQTNQVGGKIIVFDGKSEKSKEEKAAEDSAKSDEATKKAAEDAAKKAEKKDDGKAAADSLDQGLAALRKSLGFWKDDDKKKDDKAAEDKKKADADASAAEAAAKDAKDEKADDEGADKGKPRSTKRSRSSLTPELVETVVQTATRAAVEANKAAQPRADKVEDKEDSLSDADKRDLQVFKYLERQNPDKYKDASKQFIKFTKEFDKYREKWESENDGKEFDPASEDHDSFYAKHQPQYDPADLEEAKIHMRVEEKLKEREKSQEDRYGKLETKLLEQELGPVIERRTGEAVASMVGAVDKDLAKVLIEKGPEAVAESDPIAFDVLDRSAADLRHQLSELEKLSHPSGRFQFDEKNPVHVAIDRFAVGLEQSIKEMPMDDQIRDGKLFATQAEFRRVPDSQKSRYWTLGPDGIRNALIAETSNQAKKMIQGERDRVEKYLKSRGLVATKAPDSAKGDDKKGESGSAAKPNSPAASTDAGNAAAMKMGDSASDPAIKSLVTKLFPA